MISADGSVWRRAALLVGFLSLALAESAHSQVNDDPQAWLVTYGPGEIYWQRFGHNAIWIRDSGLGLDHVFNFGFFDFAQKGFLFNFIQGRLQYFAAARPAQVEFAEYMDENRSIRAQRLALTPGQLQILTNNLVDAVRPENREYLYDYYRNNCSTRVRDALDEALGLELSRTLRGARSDLNYRDHTRRLTQMDFWLYLGLETGLASPVDAPISIWEEMFIPGVLADSVAVFSHPESGENLVIEDTVLFESTQRPPSTRPGVVWHRYLIIPSGLALILGLAVYLIPRLSLNHVALGWFVLTAILGSVLVYFWMFTDHWVSRLNLNLLLLNPLWALIPLMAVLRKPITLVAVVAGLVSLLMIWLPPAQYNVDVIAAILPANLLAAFVILKARSVPEVGH